MNLRRHKLYHCYCNNAWSASLLVEEAGFQCIQLRTSSLVTWRRHVSSLCREDSTHWSRTWNTEVRLMPRKLTRLSRSLTVCMLFATNHLHALASSDVLSTSLPVFIIYLGLFTILRKCSRAGIVLNISTQSIRPHPTRVNNHCLFISVVWLQPRSMEPVLWTCHCHWTHPSLSFICASNSWLVVRDLSSPPSEKWTTSTSRWRLKVKMHRLKFQFDSFFHFTKCVLIPLRYDLESSLKGRKSWVLCFILLNLVTFSYHFKLGILLHAGHLLRFGETSVKKLTSWWACVRKWWKFHWKDRLFFKNIQQTIT